MPHYKATRKLLAIDLIILNFGQVTRTTPELAPPLLTTTPHQREDDSALDRFNEHNCPTRWVFSGTGLELVTRQVTIRCLYHSATAASIGHGSKENKVQIQVPSLSLNYNSELRGYIVDRSCVSRVRR
ncbi:uncharacterized protein TNCV_2394471 [Trichonephila clavipes]|nr:uncharacterized protein TNCV_2394471 [Trichonephila clavipes]